MRLFDDRRVFHRPHPSPNTDAGAVAPPNRGEIGRAARLHRTPEDPPPPLRKDRVAAINHAGRRAYQRREPERRRPPAHALAPARGRRLQEQRLPARGPKLGLHRGERIVLRAVAAGLRDRDQLRERTLGFVGRWARVLRT